MALTKGFLKNLGIDDISIVDAIMNENGKSLDYWKEEVEKYKAEVASLHNVNEENEKLKSDLKKAEGITEKYNNIKNEFDEYKNSITAKEEKASKAAAVKEYFKSKNIYFILRYLLFNFTLMFYFWGYVRNKQKKG